MVEKCDLVKVLSESDLSEADIDKINSYINSLPAFQKEEKIHRESSYTSKDPEVTVISKNLEESIKIIKGFKNDLCRPLDNYQQKYSKEIDEGDNKIALLLEEGKKEGYDVNNPKIREQLLEQAFTGKELFVPTSETPILNFLYFSMKETENIDSGYRLLNERKKNEDDEHAIKFYNKDDKHGEESLPDMTKMAFKTVDVETFKKISKLKSLATSLNTHEAEASLKKCKILCEKYYLDFDKIPAIK